MPPVSTRLPTGATLDPTTAEAIVQDPDRCRQAYAYWADRFEQLGERVFEGEQRADTPAMRFARALPNQPLKDLYPERSYLFQEVTRDGIRDVWLVGDAGCLLSADEIASFLNPGASAQSMFDDLKAFREAAELTGAAPALIAPSPEARGLQAARELYDVARRYAFAERNSREFGVPVPDLLALHRQEGSLCVTPAPSSFPHGPLIHTAPRTCRTPEVLYAVPYPRTERPGFSLVSPYPLTNPSFGHSINRTSPSLDFEMMWANMVVTGGLDAIVAWNPETDYDELRQVILFARVYGTFGPMDAMLDRRFERLFKYMPSDQVRFIKGIVIPNLVMAEVERRDALPDPDAFFETVLGDLTALWSAHRVEEVQRGIARDLHLVGTGAGLETLLVLRVLATWYGSRRSCVTLLARRDRVGPMTRLPELPPFLSYLRFHAMDVIFVGILLRALWRLREMKAVWEGLRGRERWGQQMLTALARSGWARQSKAERKSLEQQLTSDVTYWMRNVLYDPARRGPGITETVWRHVGLIDAWRRSIGTRRTATHWIFRPDLPIRPASGSLNEQQLQRAEQAAAIVRRLLETITRLGVWEVLSLALEFTPITWLVQLGIVRHPNGPVAARAPMAKAHSFERARLAYEDAYLASRLQPVP